MKINSVTPNANPTRDAPEDRADDL